VKLLLPSGKEVLMVQDPGKPGAGKLSAPREQRALGLSAGEQRILGKSCAGQRTDLSQIEAHVEAVGWQIYCLAQLLGERLKMPEMLDLAESMRRSNVDYVRRTAAFRATYVGTGEEPKAGTKKAKKAVTQAVPEGVTESVTVGAPVSDKEWAAALLKTHPAFRNFSPGG
jgi:hypothetical protein